MPEIFFPLLSLTSVLRVISKDTHRLPGLPGKHEQPRQSDLNENRSQVLVFGIIDFDDTVHPTTPMRLLDDAYRLNDKVSVDSFTPSKKEFDRFLNALHSFLNGLEMHLDKSYFLTGSTPDQKKKPNSSWPRMATSMWTKIPKADKIRNHLFSFPWVFSKWLDPFGKAKSFDLVVSYFKDSSKKIAKSVQSNISDIVLSFSDYRFDTMEFFDACHKHSKLSCRAVQFKWIPDKFDDLSEQLESVVSNFPTLISKDFLLESYYVFDISLKPLKYLEISNYYPGFQIPWEEKAKWKTIPKLFTRTPQNSTIDASRDATSDATGS